jgi:enoyl-CoA hydratase/carnithine racemase
VSVLLVERGDGFATLTLNRPAKRNALSIELRDAISDALDELATDSEMKAVVITGAGSVFSAGFDLTEFERAVGDLEFGRELWASSDRYHDTVMRFPLPTVAAINGPALAGGFDLATLCDLRVAQPGVWFARPEVEFAIPLFGPLRELVGGALARELCFTARRVELDEAVRVGLVNRVAGDGGAIDLALELAAQIAARPRADVRALKAKVVAATGLAARPTLSL